MEAARVVVVVRVVAGLEQTIDKKPTNPYVTQFLQWFQSERGRSVKSVDAYRWELERFFLAVNTQHENLSIQKIGKMQIRSYLATLGAISPSTRERTVSCLKSFFKFLTVEGYITSNPAETISSPVIRKKVPNFFSREQYLKLIADLNTNIQNITNLRDNILDNIFRNFKESPNKAELITLIFSLSGVAKPQMIDLKLSDYNPQKLQIKFEHSSSVKLDKNTNSVLKYYLKYRISETDYLLITKTGLGFKFVNQLPSKLDMLKFAGFSRDDKKWNELVKAIDPNNLFLAFRNRAIIILLLGTGIRRIELVNLKKNDYSKSNSTITVTRKGGDQQVIELNKDVQFALDEYLSRRKDRKKELFLTNHNNKMTTDNLHYIVKNIFKNSGLKGSAHTLRHTFVTELVRTGVPLPVIQSLVGHRNADTTIRYTHIVSKDRRVAVSKLKLGIFK